MPGPLDDVQLHLVTTLDEGLAFKRWLGERHENNCISVDTETTGLDPRAPKAGLRLIQFGDTRQGWAVPWEDWRGLALEALNGWEGWFGTHNYAFECKWLGVHSDFKFPRERTIDTMLAAHILNPLGSGALKQLSVQHVDSRAAAGQSRLNQDFAEHGWDWGTVPIRHGTYWNYACLDSVLTSLLWDRWKSTLTTKYKRVFDMEMSVRFVASKMEMHGARVDLEYAQAKWDSLAAHADKIQAWGKEAFKINLASNVRLAELLMAEDETIKDLASYTPGGQMQVDKALLLLLANPENEFSERLQIIAKQTLIMRNARKTSSTYFENFCTKNYDGSVHADIRTLGARTGRMSISSPAMQQCVDGETEVLTQTGWLRIDALDDNTPVAQYAADGSIDFVIPEEVIRQPYRGDAAVLGLWGREFVYTPDHRVVTFGRDRDGARAYVEDADQWVEWIEAGTRQDRRFARAGMVAKGRVLTESERDTLRLAIIAQADGNLRTDMAETAYEVSVVIDRKVEALTDLGIPLRQGFYGHDPSRQRQRGWIKQVEVAEWLDDTSEKNFLPSILTLCSEDLRWFIEELLFWDGDYTRGASWSQANKRLASVDLVQAAAVLCGYSTSTFAKHDGFGATQLNLNLRPRRAWKGGTGYSTARLEPFDGMVYCVRVPTGMFVTRRQGLPLITGNCPKDSALVRNAFIPADGNVIVTCDYSQIEMRILAELSRDAYLQRAFLTADETGGDFFVEIGRQVYADPGFTKKDKRRTLIKSTMYGRAYGAGPETMAATAGVRVDKMKEVIDTLNISYPGINGFTHEVETVGRNREQAEGQGYVTTKVGRRLPCDSGRLYTLTNYLIQSTAADVLKEALIRLDAAGYDEYLVLPVHDEVVLDIPQQYAEQALHDVPLIMQELNHPVPFTADADGPYARWGEKYE